LRGSRGSSAVARYFDRIFAAHTGSSSSIIAGSSSRVIDDSSRGFEGRRVFEKKYTRHQEGLE